jgi:hypothetical protein
MPKHIVTQKILLLNAINDNILLFPVEILEIIKEYLFYDETIFRQKKLKYCILQMFSKDPRELYRDMLHEVHFFHSFTKKVFYHWGFNIEHRKNYKKSVQLQGMTCKYCGNYIGLKELVRKGVSFCNRVHCHCILIMNENYE